MDDPRHVKPQPGFERKAMLRFMEKCTTYHVQTSNPRRFLLLKTLYEQVTGTENSVVHVEVSHTAQEALVVHMCLSQKGSHITASGKS